jgi:hypothetical protein
MSAAKIRTFLLDILIIPLERKEEQKMTNNTLLNFFCRRLQVDIVDAYGSRETGGIANNNKVNPGVDVKLIDIPEMGYYANGDPPRGIFFHGLFLIFLHSRSKN